MNLSVAGGWPQTRVSLHTLPGDVAHTELRCSKEPGWMARGRFPVLQLHGDNAWFLPLNPNSARTPSRHRLFNHHASTWTCATEPPRMLRAPGSRMSTAHPQGDLTRAGRVCPTQLPSVGRGPLPASAKTSRPAHCGCIGPFILAALQPDHGGPPRQKGKGQELFLGAVVVQQSQPPKNHGISIFLCGLRRKTRKKKGWKLGGPVEKSESTILVFLEARKPTGGGVKKSESTLSGFLEGQKSTGGPVKKSKSRLLEFLGAQKGPKLVKKGAKQASKNPKVDVSNFPKVGGFWRLPREAFSSSGRLAWVGRQGRPLRPEPAPPTTKPRLLSLNPLPPPPGVPPNKKKTHQSPGSKTPPQPKDPPPTHFPARKTQASTAACCE